MDIRKLQRAIVDGLEDVKGQNIVVFNTEHLSPLFERVIIASGSSNRQTKALASGVREAVKSRGFPVMRTEGEENGEWIIVDCGAAVVHLMQPGIREYYHLEEIWGEKPVRMKLDTAPVRLVKAGDGDVAATAAANKVRPAGKPPRSPAASTTRPAPPARKTRSASGTTRSAPATAKARPPSEADPAAQRPAPRPRGAAAKTAAPALRKSAGAKSAPGRGVVTRTVGVKTAAKKAPARKAPKSA